ncbi:MAG TPA: GNAT family N-acetyltransferase [Candidatus Bathyarchaeia archaeon]|nr:GNAT family N-acetyltransferase [Candidatus Bathyarchaeia archaeon]
MKNIFAAKIANKELELILKRKQDVRILKSCVPEYVFEIREVETDDKIGLINFRPILTSELEEYGGHIEYEVDEKFRGNNNAAKSCFLLFPLLKKLKINPVIVTCDPSNIASVKTCEKIGGKLISTKEIEIMPDKKRLTNKYFIELN